MRFMSPSRKRVITIVLNIHMETKKPKLVKVNLSFLLPSPFLSLLSIFIHPLLLLKLNSACSAHCKNCFSASSCFVCEGDYLLSAGSCVTSCPIGTFIQDRMCTGIVLLLLLWLVFILRNRVYDELLQLCRVQPNFVSKMLAWYSVAR